jgi:CO/xanthine dehydrogenase Mo-binding subunit
MTSFRVIGQPAVRPDGVAKVTGAARYTADLSLPGTLWGKALRSPFPHARILRVDASRARRLKGVHGVLTGEDVRGVLYGRCMYDVPVLAWDRVRFAGERVAAVAAADLETAQEALELIAVEYDELPAVFDPLEALREDAPILHPEANSYVGFPQKMERRSNVLARVVWSKGDVAQGFAQADLVVEGSYTAQRVHQGYLEPHCCVVWIDDAGRVQVWAPNKAPHELKRDLAAAIGLPPERVRVNPVTIGGDFGGKGTPMDAPLCYFLARRTGRPVKMVMDYTEEFTAGCPRHAAVVQLRTGVNRDGSLVAQQARVVFNSGAYGGFKTVPGANLPGASKALGPYRVPHALVEGLQVYTNTVPGGFMRAPGSVQAVFAAESHMDEIAQRLGMDPLELRLKNLIREGEETPTGIRFQEVRGLETLRAAIEAAGYRAPKPPNVGRGIALAVKQQGYGESAAAITLNPDGSVVLRTSVFEQGAGMYTTLRQIAAEELGLPPEGIQVEAWDTDDAPYERGVGASRITRVAGMAVQRAAQEARQELSRLAAELLGWPQERITLQDGRLLRQDTGESYPWPQLLARVGRPVTGQATHVEPERSAVPSFAAQVAEVSVDPETGEVKLLRFTTAHDVGRVLNPVGHQGQINGGVVQGFGNALSEELRVEGGRVTATHFGDYKLPTVKDVPELRTVLLEAESGLGPYKSKGIGEHPVEPVPAAIANAVADAVGVRLRELPITAEKMYQALQRKGRSGNASPATTR